MAGRQGVRHAGYMERSIPLPAGIRRWLMPGVFAWPLLGLLTLVLSRATNLDWQIESGYFDAVTQTFPARHLWSWEVLGHLGTKYFTIALGLSLGIWLLRAWRHADPELLVAVTCTLVTALVAVSLNGHFKSLSAHSCPWDLQGLGGHAHFFRFLAPVPPDAGAGRCLPSGHAAVGFMWLSAIHAAARWRPRWRWPVAAGVLAFGGLCGFIQILRGAHFPSHVIMAAVTCGTIAAISVRLPAWDWLLQRLLRQRAAIQAPATAPPASAALPCPGTDRQLEAPVSSPARWPHREPAMPRECQPG